MRPKPDRGTGSPRASTRRTQPIGGHRLGAEEARKATRSCRIRAPPPGSASAFVMLGLVLGLRLLDEFVGADVDRLPLRTAHAVTIAGRMSQRIASPDRRRSCLQVVVMGGVVNEDPIHDARSLDGEIGRATLF